MDHETWLVCGRQKEITDWPRLVVRLSDALDRVREERDLLEKTVNHLRVEIAKLRRLE